MVFIGDVFLKEKVKIEFELKDVILNYEYTYPMGDGENKVLLANKKNYLLDVFKDIKGVNLANNHVFDYKNGIDEVLKFLKKNNISYCGIDDKYIELDEFVILGYCSLITNPIINNHNHNHNYKLNLIENIDFEQIKKIKKRKIVILHWGLEEYTMPRYGDVELAHKLIDYCGVDLIIGHHPHIIQPVEVYNGKYIFYSLGNFIFPDLEESSFFDGENYKFYKEKRSKRNMYGLTVEYNQDKINYFTTFFNGNCVIKKEYDFSMKIPKNNQDFLNYRKYRLKYLMIENIIKNPRIPKLDSIMKFFK